MKTSITYKQKTMNSVLKFWIRICMVFALITAQVADLYAQTLTADENSACPGSPIVLSASGFSSDVRAVDFYRSPVERDEWKPIGTNSHPDRNGVFLFVDDMGSTAVRYRAVPQDGSRIPVGPVTISLSTDCALTCHETSTGDYFNGTDFNVIGGGTKGPVTVPGNQINDDSKIESFFSDYDVVFKKTDGCGYGEVSNDFGHYFGDLKPKADSSQYSNYYWFSNGKDLNCNPFEYTFKMYGPTKRDTVWDERYYRMVMRTYLVKSPGCSNCSSASVKLETNEGSNGNFYQNADHADLMLYDDKTGVLLGTESTSKSFDYVYLKDLLCKPELDGKLLRMEIHFYGKFSLMNKNPNSTFTMKPRFEQIGCMNMAIDYVSAEIMSVCMDNSAACLGNSVSVVAAGFPFNSKYTWEVKNTSTNQWEALTIEGFSLEQMNTNKLSIPVEVVGKKQYRVYDKNTLGVSSDYIYFEITGKDCEPIQPSDIEGPANPFCIPNSKADGTFSVSPMDANPRVRYSWTFTTPSGTTFGSDKLQFSGGEFESGDRGGSVFLLLDGNAEEGEYTVTVQPIKTTVDGDEELTGTPISKKFTVYKTPKIQVIKEGTDPLHQDQVELCPTDKTQKLVAVADVQSGFTSAYLNRYIYNWTAGAVGSRYESNVSFPDSGACIGSYKSHTARVDVEIDGVGCPSKAETTWKLSEIEKPTMACPANSSLSYTLASDAKTYNVPWTFPSYTAGCETDPTLSIVLKYTPRGKAAITETINTSKSEIASITPKYFTLETGTGTITYTVTDGCGNKASCEITITVKDVTPPNLDCSKIPSYTTKLTLQEGCDAVPSYDGSLPKLTAPKLTDLNGVDGEITGTYMGRVTNPYRVQTSASFDINLFDKTIDLNENYAVGTTYILWEFADASGNKSYCVQTINVIDDRKPTVHCLDPNIGEMTSQEGECGLSVSGLFAQMTDLPSAVDVCSGEGTELTAEIYYKNVMDDDYIHVPLADFSKIIFYVDEEYDIKWRFYKVNKESYDDCDGTFSVADKEAPKFDCSLLPSIRVTANSYKPNNKGYEYLKYATKDDVQEKYGAGPAAQMVTYTGTLASAFENNDIRLIDPSEVTDNCEGAVSVFTTLTGPDDKGNEKTETITSIKQLEDHKYYVGLNTLTFQFIDAHGNTSTCTQTIIVTAGTTPIPNCPSSSDTVIYVNENCEAVFTLMKEMVPTAQIPVNQEGVWFNFRRKVIAGLHFDEACEIASQYFPNNLKGLNGYHDAVVSTGPVGPGPMGPGPMGPGTMTTLTMDFLCDQYNSNFEAFKNSSANNWNSWSTEYGIWDPMEKILSESNSLTTVKEYLGYPYEVELLDPNNESVVKVSNEYSATDIAPVRVISTRWYGSSNDAHECSDLKHSCKDAAIKVNNNFSDVVFTKTLTKGIYTLVYRFQNEKDGKQLDSCVINVEVKDSIAPVLECGDWSKSGTFAAGPDCKVPVSDVPWFKKPTAEDLNAKDNCTKEFSDFTISWKRSWKSYIDLTFDAALTDAFPIGVTSMKWVVTDQSGNEAYCEQIITVVDETGPVVDCSRLGTINAETEENCEASADAVIKAGLSQPYADDDACSPTGGRIAGVGTRDDGKGIFTDPYPLGTTTITWVFADSMGNTSECVQKVVIVDNSEPIFDACDNMEDVTINLQPEHCVASKDSVRALLGEYTAHDDCDGDIPGIPHVLMPDGTLSDLLEYFKKDTTYVIVWTFTDNSDNTVKCSHNLNIKDVTPPDIDDLCKDPEKDLVASVTCSLDYDQLGLPSIEDMTLHGDCDGDIVPQMVAKIANPDHTYYTYVGEELKTITYPVTSEGYPHKIWWVYTDKSANRDTCQTLINISDNIPPVLEDCDVDTVIRLTVSAESCAIDPEDVKPYLREPKAYDACDDYLGDVGQVWITPVVERYTVDSVCNEGTPCEYTITLVADGVTKKWDEDPFQKGRTMLKWIFTDKKGNTVECTKYVDVLDHTPPFFDCNNIDPDTLRPEAYPGECVYEFADLKKDVLDGLAYKAYDACSGDSIPGVLTLNGDMELPGEYTMQVGVLYKLLWLFKDADGNATTCPQWILPSHLNPINFDCSTLQDTIPVLAQKGECVANTDTLKAHLTIPETRDTCSKEPIFAVPYTADSTKVIDLDTYQFPTGNTTVNWMFVSPWNLHDTLWCSQVVSIKGNKSFDIDCEVVAPVVRDTVTECVASPAVFSVDTPWVADPCLTEEDPLYKRYGEGIRLDGLALNDEYPLGNTQIKWVFTDFTGSVDTFCIQDIEIRTDKKIVFNCDSLNYDTIKVDAVEGQCTVDASKVVLVTPYAKHPCTGELIEGVPSRKDGKELTDPYYVGLSAIVWTFTDHTNTLADPVYTCEQYVQVGDVNVPPVDCENYPDLVYRLNPEDCEISWEDMKLKVPAVIDLCSHDIIDPIVTRSSGKSITVVTSLVGTDTIVSVTADNFSVGVDTIYWKYTFQGMDYNCEQVILVKDSMAPIFDCSTLPDTTLSATPGECYLSSESLLDSIANPWPTAIEYCTKAEIPGRAFLETGEELIKGQPFNVSVGKHEIKWIFIDTLINEIGDTCIQNLILRSDSAPIFDCTKLPHDTIIIEGCDTTLSEQTIVTPYALDACTGDSVEGKGTRLDGGDLYGVYPVGTTTIRWVFVSPFSSKEMSCEQQITILTSQEIDFECNSLEDIPVDVKEGECSAPVELGTPIAQHPCPEQSGVTDIYGVPYLNGVQVKQPVDSFSVGIWTIDWIFRDSSGTLKDTFKICQQKIIVGDVNSMPVQCENYPDTVIVLPPTDCEISWSDMGLTVPAVVDLCSGDIINPTITRSSGAAITANTITKTIGGVDTVIVEITSDPFTVGLDTITWSYSFAGQDISCHQVIDVLDSVAPYFDCSQLQPIQMIAPKGVCEVSPEALVDSLGEWSAIDTCTKKEIPGKAFVNDVPVKDVVAHVGDTLIVHWIFIDSTLNAVAKECDQIVTVIGQSEPIFDCSSLKDTIFYLHEGECAFPGDLLKLDIPVAKDSCTGTDVPGVASRQDGLTMLDSFALGVNVIDWTFASPYSITPKVCPQNVIIKDTIKPTVNCDALVDTIKVRITADSKFDSEITYEELLNAEGFEIPYVIDPCDGKITAVGSRSDGKSMEDNYPLGSVEIVWTYTDNSGNFDTCHQVVLVEDFLIDTLYCPEGWNHKTISCDKELPPAYETYKEFAAAGGYFSNPSKMVEESFHMTETFDGTQYCDERYFRTYHVLDVRSNDITCTDTIYVVDDQAPVFNTDLRDITIACTETVPTAEQVEVTDCDPNPTLKVTETSNQGSDPSRCDYYTYDIKREWTATDRCGNTSSMVQYVHVVDTIGPRFNFPDNWKDSVLSLYRKGCLFEVPDFSVDVSAIVSDNCSDVSNLSIVQTPKAGVYITSSTDVKVVVSDMCGNKDSLFINVYVPKRTDVVSIKSYDTTSCVSDTQTINLNSQKIRFARGSYYIVDEFDGELVEISSTFFYDIYKGHVADNTLFFTSNPKNSKLPNFNEIKLLNRKSQSDVYYFVATDTLTLCADTSSSYVKLKERPRISMGSGEHEICEFVHVDSTSLYEHLYCVNNMGGDTVLSEGWLYGGEPFDLEKDTIKYTETPKYFAYYSENECGVTTSMNSYFEICDDAPLTTKDSLEYVGSEKNLKLLREEKLIIPDSILFNVHKRMSPDDIAILTEPHDPARIWQGEPVELEAVTKYPYSELVWYKVMGKFDREGLVVGTDEFEFEFDEESDDEKDSIILITGYDKRQIIVDYPQDTAKYYITLSDGVCPSVASNPVQVNVIIKLPTAFTPYDLDGMNDIFMERHKISIFDRYGQKVFEGDNGWDGSYKGRLADPGVYFYSVIMTDGSVRNGTIEIVFLNK